MAGFRAGISVGGSGIDAAGFGDGACSRQYRFEKCGFTALEWAHQRNAPWTSGTSDVLSHSPPPSILKSAHDRVGGSNAPPVPGFWQAGKCRCGAVWESGENQPVIASEAKQSTVVGGTLDCFVANAYSQ